MAEGAGIQIAFELGEADIAYFRKRLEDARARQGELSEDKIIAAAEELASSSTSGTAPAFLTQRIDTLNEMIAMLKDTDWRLEGDDRAVVLNTLVYFADPHDLIPDSIPGIGLLDDAIMIDLAAQELAPELTAFREFCENRDELKEGAEYAEPLEVAREQLQGHMRRMRRRRSRRAGRGGSQSYSLFHTY